jgi:hypothetical protein
VVTFCEHDKGPVGFIRDKDFHGQLSDFQILLREISYVPRDWSVQFVLCVV